LPGSSLQYRPSSLSRSGVAGFPRGHHIREPSLFGSVLPPDDVGRRPARRFSSCRARLTFVAMLGQLPESLGGAVYLHTRRPRPRSPVCRDNTAGPTGGSPHSGAGSPGPRPRCTGAARIGRRLLLRKRWRAPSSTDRKAEVVVSPACSHLTRRDPLSKNGPNSGPSFRGAHSTAHAERNRSACGRR